MVQQFTHKTEILSLAQRNQPFTGQEMLSDQMTKFSSVAAPEVVIISHNQNLYWLHFHASSH